MTLVAAADGSALGNPGPAGWAWYIDDDCWAAGGWPNATNNQGELMAVIDLLEQTSHLASTHLTVRCDSQYVINTITQWMPGWKRKGWRKADGSPVMNLDYVQRLDALMVGRDVSFEWVKGHAGDRLNEAADKRARAAATAFQNGAVPDSGPGFHSDVATAGARVPPGPASASGPTRSLGLGPISVPTVTARPSFTGAPGESDEDAAIRLETLWMRDDVRADRSAMLAMTHPDFQEVQTSGTRWDHDQFLEMLERHPDGRLLEIRLVRSLAPGVVLLSYSAETRFGLSERTSIWVKQPSGLWQTIFHQGTRRNPPAT